MEVHDLGEFGLIAHLRAALPPPDARLIVGPGDDAAVWRSARGCLIATTDTMVAGVHVLPDRVGWHGIGWKALATNISDIAAMGGRPDFALITLHLPSAARVEDIDALYAGLRACAEAYGVSIAGGDVVAAPQFAITVALTGTATLDAAGEPLLLRRSSAKPGDAIAVTGPLGGSAAGLRALLNDDAGHHAAALIQRHMHPIPRIDAGAAAIAAGIRSGIDISDGLLQDIGHICAASGTGADIAQAAIPLDAAAAATCPADAAMLAATGGEDYELVLVAPEHLLAQAGAALLQPLTIIGHMTADGGVRLLDANGAEITVPHGGWDHLRSTGGAQ